MIQKIKIEIDTDKKAIQKIEMPEDINVLEAGKIFQALAMQMIGQVRLANENDKVIPIQNKLMVPHL